MTDHEKPDDDDTDFPTLNNNKSKKFKFFKSLKSKFNTLPPPKLKWLISPIAFVIYSTIFNIVDQILFAKFTKQFHMVSSLDVIFLFLDVFIFLVVIYEQNYYVEDEAFSNKYFRYGHFIVVKILKKVLWVLLLASCIAQVVIISQGRLSNPLNIDDYYADNINLSGNERAGYFIISLISLICNGALLGIWWSTNISSVYLLFASTNLITILIGISIVQININYINTISGSSRRLHNLFILTGTFMTLQSGIGLCIVLLINEKNRLKDFIGRIIFIYDIYVVLLFSLLLGCTIVSGIYFDYKQSFPISIFVLFLCSCITSVVAFFCTRYFRLRGDYFTKKYEVEEYDLASLTTHQKQGWGKLIDMNHKYNGGVTGDYVVSLMENYCHSDLPGMTCKVLRVYNKEVDTTVPKNNNTTTTKSHKNMSAAFDNLDQESVLFSDTPTLTEETYIRDLENEYRPLSKNQLKRLAKKNQKEKKKQEMLSLENNTEKFYQELMNTEALVLLTIVEEFDLTERIPGWFGKKLHKWVGKDSKFPILCIRFGLLGFHWPFKRSTFYTSSTKKPVARSAAVLYAISKWNETHEKLTVLLDPTYKDANFEAGITSSGWYKINLPNSHIIDLRPFKNQTSTDYFKAIKYRTQENAFKQANGQVIESNTFNYETCEDIISMNDHIANNRQSSGQSSQLLQPDWEFIYNLGNYSNEKKYRSLLFLKVDDEIIASCVIFRLGDTMTSDIQGLNHAISKQYKAYFVMMQEVIKIGLREGVKFIDFGPTTEDAKVTIGCNVVPLCGSIYPKNKCLGPIIKFAASKVDV
ncbi:hypothetical protein SBY92_004605 [Candida maltosa Xu316]|uniref:BioF2-like acetyltransferase domain-containing protein n=1 Tax=Candida maltosa (strain Xu316) TaxID=1245528 RepID=M3J238_CANMX|nr:hypothetical protein G210_3855 [Candida maltosa Xu316]